MVINADQAAPPSATLLMLEGRALWEFGAFMASLPALQFTRRGDGHPVFVLPGLIASDMSTRPLRAFLAHHGYRSYGWNWGVITGRAMASRSGCSSGCARCASSMDEK